MSDVMKNDDAVINLLHWLITFGIKGQFTVKFPQVALIW